MKMRKLILLLIFCSLILISFIFAIPYYTVGTNSTNSTLNGSDIEHRLQWNDDTGLSGYIFQFCNGTWDGSRCIGEGTTIQLQDADTENLDDAHMYKNNPTTNYGISDSIRVTRSTFDSGRVYMKYNISGIPDGNSIISAILYLYLESEFLDTGEAYNISVYSVYVNNWSEGSTGGVDVGVTSYDKNITWDNQPCGSDFDDSGECNLTRDTYTTYTEGDGVNIWMKFVLTSTISRCYANNEGNCSFVLKTPEDDADTDTLRWSSKEVGTPSQRPYINVTYYSEEDWVNDSWVEMTGTINWSNITKRVTSTVGANVSWRVYANDTSNNWNVSDVYSYVTTVSADTIPPQVTITVNDTSPKINYNISIQVNSTESGHCWIYDNMSMSNSTPISCNITQTYIINVSGGNNISFNAYANDSTGNLNDTVSLTILVSNSLPTITSITINATDNPLNRTTANLTAYNSSITDADGDATKMLWDWRLNGISDTVLNIPFENDSAFDLSSYENHGEVSGAVYNSTGGFDGFGAYDFDEDKDYIVFDETPFNQNITEGITLMSWVYMRTNSSYNYIFSKYDNDLLISVTSAGGYHNRVRFFFKSSSGVTDSDTNTYELPLQKWVHLTNVLYRIDSDTVNMSMFANGNLTFSASRTFDWFHQNSSFNFTIGTEADRGLYGWNGSIDEVRIYNRSLTPDEIKLIYENNTNVLHSDATSSGDNWTVAGYPTDSEDIGTMVTSNYVLIDNTPPATPTIIYPVDGASYSLINISLNVSSSDVDGDAITYYYFINNSLNKTSINNHSFAGYDSDFNFTTMATDGTDFSGNISIIFTLDTIAPMSNISINNTSPEINGVINVSLNVSDRLNLSYCWFFNNMSMTNSSLIALEGRTYDNSVCNNVSIINVSVYNDVLFRGYVNDTANNINFSEIVITIADTIKPMSNISINNTSPELNEWVNVSLNVSDNEALSHCWFWNNMSFTNSSLIALSGASDHSRCNNISSINVTQGNDVLFIGYVNDTSNNLNYSEIVITITDTTPPTLTNLKFYALNGSKNVIGINETSFNFTNLEDIEYMEINFTLTDVTSLDDIKLFYTANGTSACALGNNQSSTCYNFNSDTWIEFINDSSTSTFIDWGTTGDYINCDFIGTATARNYTCRLDEHYNPNVWKHYPLNFSDSKWESEVNQRIKKNTIWRINLTNLNVPLDADFYKIDFRVNASIGLTPTQQILTYICNSSFLTGDPSTSTSCKLVGAKLPSQLTDDGTKAREIFTKNLTTGLGDFGCVMITTDSPAAKYYSMKTYKFMGTDNVRTDISTNNGDSYTTLADGYETELNINWFYDNLESNTTRFLLKIQSNDTLGNTGNSSLFSMSWISGELNEPPIVDIIVPEIGTNHSGNIQINWTTAEPNGHDFITNITLSNNTITNIASNLDRTIVNFTFDSTTVSDGIYNLTVRSCETSTTELYCGNDTHEITIDNTLPTVTLLTTFTNTFSQELKYTATDNTAIDTCFYSLLTQSGVVAISNTTIAGCANTTFSTGSYGSFILYIYANDTSDNIGYDSANFTVTDISPGTSGGGGGPVTSPSEYTYTVGYICDKVELFREDHTSFTGELIYDSYDLDSLKNQIRSEKGFTMIDTVLEDYINNYILICIENDTKKAPSKKWGINWTGNASVLTLNLEKYEIESNFWGSYIPFPFHYTILLEEIDDIEETKDIYDYVNLVLHLKYSDEFTKRLAIVTDGVRSWFVVIIVILISLSIWRIFRKKDE